MSHSYSLVRKQAPIKTGLYRKVSIEDAPIKPSEPPDEVILRHKQQRDPKRPESFTYGQGQRPYTEKYLDSKKKKDGKTHRRGKTLSWLGNIKRRFSFNEGRKGDSTKTSDGEGNTSESNSPESPGRPDFPSTVNGDMDINNKKQSLNGSGENRRQPVNEGVVNLRTHSLNASLPVNGNRSSVEVEIEPDVISFSRPSFTQSTQDVRPKTISRQNQILSTMPALSKSVGDIIAETNRKTLNENGPQPNKSFLHSDKNLHRMSSEEEPNVLVSHESLSSLPTVETHKVKRKPRDYDEIILPSEIVENISTDKKSDQHRKISSSSSSSSSTSSSSSSSSMKNKINKRKGNDNSCVSYYGPVYIGTNQQSFPVDDRHSVLNYTYSKSSYKHLNYTSSDSSYTHINDISSNYSYIPYNLNNYIIRTDKRGKILYSKIITTCTFICYCNRK